MNTRSPEPPPPSARDCRVANETVLDLIAADPWRMAVLRAVRTLDLPDWAIGAGFVRARVWDWLSGYTTPTRPSDIDVLYYDPADLSPDRESRRRSGRSAPSVWKQERDADPELPVRREIRPLDIVIGLCGR